MRWNPSMGVWYEAVGSPNGNSGQVKNLNGNCGGKMAAIERRSSDRVSLLNAIRVSGKDSAGVTFSDVGRTVLVTLHGAAVIVKRELAPNQRLIIRCYGTETDAEARVVGQIEKQSDGSLYG